jgi:signal transduction histidine kinase
MTILLALTISVVLQFIAAIIAVNLIRRTKYNISWVLISAAFLLMAFRRLVEVMDVWKADPRVTETPLSSWTAVVTSILMLVGVIYIRRIFNLQKRIDDMKRENESRILSAIIRTEESERQKFAKELHDGLGPLLASIKMAISALDGDRVGPGHRKILDNADHLIDESVTTLKEISNKLSPHVLNNFGLLKAVQAFIDRLEVPGSPTLKLNSNLKEVRFDYNIEVVMYRVICELITNTLQHAEATEVNIDLYHEKERLTLDYFDNGKGFDPQEVVGARSGMGFSNVQSRIKSLDGTIRVISNPNEGACISIVINTAPHE